MLERANCCDHLLTITFCAFFAVVKGCLEVDIVRFRRRVHVTFWKCQRALFDHDWNLGLKEKKLECFSQPCAVVDFYFCKTASLKQCRVEAFFFFFFWALSKMIKMSLKLQNFVFFLVCLKAFLTLVKYFVIWMLDKSSCDRVQVDDNISLHFLAASKVIFDLPNWIEWYAARCQRVVRVRSALVARI